MDYIAIRLPRSLSGRIGYRNARLDLVFETKPSKDRRAPDEPKWGNEVLARVLAMQLSVRKAAKVSASAVTVTSQSLDGIRRRTSSCDGEGKRNRDEKSRNSADCPRIVGGTPGRGSSEIRRQLTGSEAR